MELRAELRTNADSQGCCPLWYSCSAQSAGANMKIYIIYGVYICIICISVCKCMHLIPWVILVCAVPPLRGAERWVLVSRGGFMAP